MWPAFVPLNITPSLQDHQSIHDEPAGSAEELPSVASSLSILPQAECNTDEVGNDITICELEEEETKLEAAILARIEVRSYDIQLIHDCAPSVILLCYIYFL